MADLIERLVRCLVGEPRALAETYKGRRLKVRRMPGEWGFLELHVNGRVVDIAIGVDTNFAECMDRLKSDVDAADAIRAMSAGQPAAEES